MIPFAFLCVIMGPCASLWVLMRLHGLHCVLKGFNKALCVFMGPYGSL